MNLLLFSFSLICHRVLISSFGIFSSFSSNIVMWFSMNASFSKVLLVVSSSSAKQECTSDTFLRKVSNKTSCKLLQKYRLVFILECCYPTRPFRKCSLQTFKSAWCVPFTWSTVVDKLCSWTFFLTISAILLSMAHLLFMLFTFNVCVLSSSSLTKIDVRVKWSKTCLYKVSESELSPHNTLVMNSIVSPINSLFSVKFSIRNRFWFSNSSIWCTTLIESMQYFLDEEGSNSTLQICSIYHAKTC